MLKLPWRFEGKWVWLKIERSKLRSWRGKKAPLSIYVRMYHKYGNKIWFYLYGPDIFKWAKEQK